MERRRATIDAEASSTTGVSNIGVLAYWQNKMTSNDVMADND
jgi:hypothetical protein